MKNNNLKNQGNKQETKTNRKQRLESKEKINRDKDKQNLWKTEKGLKTARTKQTGYLCRSHELGKCVYDT